MTTTNDELKELMEEIIGQMTTLIELVTGGGGTQPPEPEYPSGGSIFNRTETRWLQIRVSRNLKIPKVKNGQILYNDKGGMRVTLPPVGQRRKFRVGDKIKVYRPHVQGDGQLLYEVYEYPGNFLQKYDVLRI